MFFDRKIDIIDGYLESDQRSSSYLSLFLEDFELLLIVIEKLIAVKFKISH